MKAAVVAALVFPFIVAMQWNPVPLPRPRLPRVNDEAPSLVDEGTHEDGSDSLSHPTRELEVEEEDTLTFGTFLKVVRRLQHLDDHDGHSLKQDKVPNTSTQQEQNNHQQQARGIQEEELTLLNDHRNRRALSGLREDVDVAGGAGAITPDGRDDTSSEGDEEQHTTAATTARTKDDEDTDNDDDMMHTDLLYKFSTQ